MNNFIKFTLIFSITLLLTNCFSRINNKDDYSYLSITSHAEGATINSFRVTFTGKCDDTYSFFTYPSEGIKIISESCSGKNLNIVAEFRAVNGEPETRTITIVNGEKALERTLSIDLSCPTGFIGVPGNTDIGTSDFCVAKYEMKDNGSEAESKANGTPWANITSLEALSECSLLTNLNHDYYLITNDQWQTIARNIENVNSNWSGGTVGDGCLFRGHVGVFDNCGYITNDNPDFAIPQDRSLHLHYSAKLTLSNGEEIWDFSGNVGEWVDFTGTGDSISYDNSTEGWHEINSVEANASYGGDILARNFLPTNSEFDSTYAIGQIGFALSPATGIYVIRGSSWYEGTAAGAFAASLSDDELSFSVHIGFRCSASVLTLTPSQ